MAVNMRILADLHDEIVMKMEKSQQARDAGRVPTTNSIEMTFAEADEVRKLIENCGKTVTGT